MEILRNDNPDNIVLLEAVNEDGDHLTPMMKRLGMEPERFQIDYAYVNNVNRMKHSVVETREEKEEVLRQKFMRMYNEMEEEVFPEKDDPLSFEERGNLNAFQLKELGNNFFEEK